MQKQLVTIGIICVTFFSVICGSVSAQTAAQSNPAQTVDKVILQGLDKVTARVFTLEYHIGEVIRFGTLEIVVRKCWQSSPEDLPEQAAFLDIVETRPGERTEWIFRGWMFASSPAISSLEHAVYDVWLLNCIPAQPQS